MKRIIQIAGIAFTFNGNVISKEYMSKFGVTFNTGDLRGCDQIRWNITKSDDTSGAAFEELNLTEAYVDVTINMADYFNARFTETGSYILYIQLCKGSTFVAGENIQFYFCKYAYYQMGITAPNIVRSVFRPAVYTYSQNGLHVDTETAVADYVEFEVGGYTERRKVHNGTASADVSEYLRQIFKDIDPWKFEALSELYSFVSENPVYSYNSVIIKLFDKNGKLIGVGEHEIDCFFSVENYFDKYNVFNNIGKWRKRMVYWNMPFTYDMFVHPLSSNNEYQFSVGFGFKKPVYYATDNIYIEGRYNIIFGYNIRSVQINLNELVKNFNEGGTDQITFNLLEKAGFYLKSDRSIDSTLEPTSQIGIDCDISASTCGVYLRWISRFGEHCYWMFKEGTTTHETKSASEFKRISDTFKESNIRNVETTKIMKIGDAVKDDYLDFLASLSDGWAVQMYNAKDGTWTDVEVQDSKITYGSAAAGNTVEFEIAFPQTNLKF